MIIRMSSGPWLHPKTGVLYYRKVVPVQLRPFIGKTEIKQSLGTRDIREARRAWSEVDTQVQRQLISAKAQLNGNPGLDYEAIENLGRRWATAEKERLSTISSLRDVLIVTPREGLDQNDLPVKYVEITSIWSEQISTPIETNTTAALDHILGETAGRILRASGQALQPDSEQYRDLLVTLAANALRLGEWARKRYEALQEQEAIENQGQAQRKNMTIAEAWEAYSEKVYREAENQQTASNRLADYKAAVDNLRELLGNKPITQVTRDDILRYRDLLWTLPTRPPMTIKSLPLEEQAARAKTQGLPTLSRGSVRNRLMAVSALFTAVIDMPGSGLTENPGAGVRIPPRVTTSGTSKEKDYRREELERIFGSDWFKSFSPLPRADFGTATFWLPILMYYTGSRLNEIAGLDVADIQQLEGVWCIRIRANREGKSTKNSGSVRDVPIHSDLIDLGFLTYVRSLPADSRLWPKLKPSAKGKYGYHLSKRWSRYLETLGKRSEVSPSHGFRHTFTGLLRAQGVDRSVIARLDGHISSHQTDEYGSFRIALLKESIERLPSLPHLSALKAIAKQHYVPLL